MPRKKVKDQDALERDDETTAVINVGSREYTSYVKQKQLRDAMIARITTHDSEIDLFRKELKKIDTKLNKVLKALESFVESKHE